MVSVSLRDLGFASPCRVRNLWEHKDLAAATKEIAAAVPPHGAILLRVTPEEAE